MTENRYSCEDVAPIEQEPRHHLVFANEFVRAFAVEIAPHECTLCHHHAHDYLMYVVGDAQIVSAPRDAEPKIHTYRDGDCEVSPAGLVHVVENLRETAFRNVVVELLPGLGELHRGADPIIVAGNGTVQTIFGEERVTVWSLEMEGDGQAEVYGPAVVAALNADGVKDISWIAGDRELVGCDSGRSVRTVLFLLGHPE